MASKTTEDLARAESWVKEMEGKVKGWSKDKPAIIKVIRQRAVGRKQNMGLDKKRRMKKRMSRSS